MMASRSPAGASRALCWSCGLDGVHVESVGGTGLAVISAGTVGVWVDSSANTGVYANTAKADGEWGFDTPERSTASNVTFNTLTLLAQVAGADALTAGDLVTVVGVGQPLLDSATLLALVRRPVAWAGRCHRRGGGAHGAGS